MNTGGTSTAMAASTASGMSSSMNMHMMMPVVFHNDHITPLYSSAWTPTSSGAYAGTCIFLIILAVVGRGLLAFRSIMEQRWLAAHLNRRYVVIAGKTPEAGRIDADPDAKFATLVTAQGVEENVKVVRRVGREPIPWRFSVDVPRALIFLCISGVLYLLMLAVMTLNVGYFLSVLTGAFLGDLAVGRYIHVLDHEH